MDDVLLIDGSYGEGGGQILRTSLAFSALLGRPVRITKIRARRPRPGLQPQHLACVQALQRITNARVRGAALDSMELEFVPRGIRGGTYTINIGTAGSVTLLLQCLVLPLLFAPEPSNLRIIGGTDVEHAPTYDYFANVFVPWVSRMGASVSVRLKRRGYYPKGGGEVVISIQPVSKLSPIRLERFEEPSVIRGISHAGALPEHVAVRQAEAASKRLESAGYDADIDVVMYSRSEVLCPGSGITLWTENMPIGASSLGAKGVLAEVVGKRAANYLIHQLDAKRPVDMHMADQLIPYMAIADGVSILRATEATMHLVTNLWVVERFLGVSADVQREERRSVVVKLRGVGFKVEKEEQG